MSRRLPFVVALCASLLLTGPTAAQSPSPSPSPSLVAADPSLPPEPASPEPSVSLAPVASAPAEEAVEPLPEVDFKVGDWKLHKVLWKNLRFNGGRPMPIETEGPQDAKGIPLRPLGRGGRLVYNPTVLAQQGMKRLDSYVQTGNKYHLRQARKYANKLAKLSDGGKRRRWQPHWYPLSVHKAGWVNSNSHGLTLSFLSRFYEVTGAQQRLKEARRLMAAFEQRPRNDRWFSDVTAKDYIWFEHWPDGRNERTLNAHLNAMFGIYDFWHSTGDPLAELYFLGGAKTVRDKLYRFRRKGELSRYSLSSPDGSLHYHDTHIEQLRILSRMTGDEWFAKQADLFERDKAAWRAKYRGAARAAR